MFASLQKNKCSCEDKAQVFYGNFVKVSHVNVPSVYSVKGAIRNYPNKEVTECFFSIYPVVSTPCATTVLKSTVKYEAWHQRG